MYALFKAIQYLFPLIALALLIIGIKKNAIYYIISSLWLSLIALVIHYQASGGEILGTYFDYLNAAIYSFNLIVLAIALIRIISHLGSEHPVYYFVSSFLKAFIIIGSILVFINLWMNAYFIENRMNGTPVMQVALMQKPDYCDYRYLFYKVTREGYVDYLCPNYYGLIPSIGHLEISPDFITTQLTMPNKRKLLLLQQNKNQ
ncbi:MAG: type I secretion system protein LssZ [Legionella sp.]|nr:type I secretion system protein LssZ [Legionella sp.]